MISDNVKNIREAIRRYADPTSITIVGAAKSQTLERIEEAYRAGITVMASNYAQEGETFQDALGHLPIEWHFIGHIQSRKVKFLPRYQCVQSLERLEVAEALHARLSEGGTSLRVLVEINIGDESQKSGISVAEAPTFFSRLKNFSSLKVEGLMGMPPPLEPVEARRPYFKKLRQLFDSLGGDYPLKTLSMGTSGDYLVAVEERCTMIRLGEKLFGARPKKL